MSEAENSILRGKTTRTNWRKVADVLASRLVHHVYCQDGCESVAEGVERGCPFCRDIAAYGVYVKAGGTVSLDSWNEVIGTNTISINDLLKKSAEDVS